MPGKITDDPQRLKAACDLIGGMTKDDKELVAWIAAADVLQMEELNREDKSNKETERQGDTGTIQR